MNTISYSILGIEVQALSRRAAFDRIQNALTHREFTRVAFCNAHTANLAYRDRNFRSILRSFLVLPDGVGMDLAATLLHGRPFPHNLNGSDFSPDLLRTSHRPLKIGLVGGRPGVAERAAEALRSLDARHAVTAIGHGYPTGGEEQLILDTLRREPVDLLFVAMGNPAQEVWIEKHLDIEMCTVACGVGALFDFLAGEMPRAPVAIRKVRLEWMFRFLIEPKRLWGRYIVGNPAFLLRVMRQRILRSTP